MEKPATSTPLIGPRNYFQEAKKYYQKTKKKYFGKKKKKLKIELNEKGLLGAVKKRNKALKDAADM